MIDQHDRFFPEVVRPPSRQEQDGSDLLYPRYSGPCNARFTSTSFLAMAGAGVLVTLYDLVLPYARCESGIHFPSVSISGSSRRLTRVAHPLIEAPRRQVESTSTVRLQGKTRWRGLIIIFRAGGGPWPCIGWTNQGARNRPRRSCFKTHNISRQSYSPALWLTRRDSTAACTVSTAKRSFR
jgi:hypothetical protein